MYNSAAGKLQSSAEGFEILTITQFSSDFPKLLLVGLVERTCRRTVIREIPGITECFRVKDDGKDLVKVFIS